MQDDLSKDSFARGVELQRAQRFAEAAESYRRAAQTRLTSNLASNLGVCLGELGDWVGATHYLELAAGHQPANANFHRFLGSVYAEAGQADRAERAYRTALAAKPGDLSVELALAGLYLSLGRYAEGWPLLAARIPLHPDVVPPINLGYPEWRGEPLDGKSVLVWVEQGFGDQIQMCRFVGALKARGAARVTLGCRPALAHLFSTLTGADSIIPVARGTRVSVPSHDYWSRYFSLPGALDITLENLPAQPYLTAPVDRRERWSHAKGIGLAWQASPTGFNAGNKGMPAEVARRILDRGAMSLHPEDTGARDFADTAAIIARLDLVISIDTSVAHLAGAMGKPCWTLLPYVHADWRWLRERTDSPWYPSLKLYRQTRPRDWSETVEQVLRDL
jgi:hypothetical protein